MRVDMWSATLAAGLTLTSSLVAAADDSTDGPALGPMVQLIQRSDDPSFRLDLLEGMAKGLEGQRQVAMPDGWREVYPDLTQSPKEKVRRLARRLALRFGDDSARKTLRKKVANGDLPAAKRREALDALLGVKDPKLPDILLDVLRTPPLRKAAIRGLAAYNADGAAKAILARYSEMSEDAKSTALQTLASREKWASALLDAVAAGRIPREDLTTVTVRKIRRLGDASLAKKIEAVWGAVRKRSEEKAAQIARYKKMLTEEALADADPRRGRVVFDRTCGNCHTLFGEGGKLGPDLTGSDRTNIDYLLENVVAPNALVGEDYQMVTVRTKGGRLVTGVIAARSENALTIRTIHDKVIIPRGEVAKRSRLPVSMMPEGQLKSLSKEQILDLFAYLRSPKQVKRPKGSTPPTKGEDGFVPLFDGKSLEGWEGPKDWFRVEDGHLVGGDLDKRIPANKFLTTKKTYRDFELRLEVKLVDGKGNSGIQFRSRRKDGHVVGYQADVGKGWWGKLYDEHRRRKVLAGPDEQRLKKVLNPKGWNRYRIRCEGDHIQLFLNGYQTVDYVEKEDVAEKGVIGLQIHSGKPSLVRFRNIRVRRLDTK